jgi:sulfate adenylyltransferase
VQSVLSDVTELAGAPVVQPDDLAVADVELALDGLLRHRSPLGEVVPAPQSPPSVGSAPVVTLRLPEDQLPALDARTLVVTDAESTPVAVLRDVRPSADDPTLVEGELHRLRPPETGLGRNLRLGAVGFSDDDARQSRVRSGSAVVVLGRPLLNADDETISSLSSSATGVVLVVPVAGPSPDGVPAETLLRIARKLAPRLAARVLAVPLAWRDARSDEALVAHVGVGLQASQVLHLRPARYAVHGSAPAGDDAWPPLLHVLRAGQELAPDAVADVTREELVRWRPPRRERGLVVFFTGLSGSGKSTLARALAAHLSETGERTVSLLDGDVVRRLLSSGLGFGAGDRDLNVRRIGYVAAEIARHGGVAVCAPIAPYEVSRAAVRAMVEEVGDFLLVHVNTPIEECERRDLKGLYARARAGQITQFTGVTDPYEEPEDADLRVDTRSLSREDALRAVLGLLRSGGWIPTRTGS